MAINLTGGLPPEILGQQQQLNRQQQMAQMLMQQGQQMPQGQMVSGRYVQPSIFASLAPLAQMYAGQKIAERGDKQALDLAKQLRQTYGDELKEFRNLMQGREELAPEQAGPTQTGQAIPQEMVRGAPNRQGAYDFASRAYNPALQAIGLKNLTPEAITLTEGQRRLVENPDGTFREVASGGEKTSPEYNNYLKAIKDPINPFKGGFTDYQLSLKRAGASNINLGQKVLDNTLKLRGDFRSEPIYKDFQAINSAYSQINTGLNAGTAAGDLAASTKLMKLLDPTSVVRESELVMAMQATGKLDQLYNYANKIATGQFLSPKQKGEFRSLATEFYNSAGEQYNEKRDEYAGIAERNQLNVPDVVGSAVKLKPQIIKTPEGRNKPAAEKVAPAPKGFDQKLWNVMTPEERALF
jgi:hypothetical protein